MNTAITYFHMHFEPWQEFVRGARYKLSPYVDIDDPTALRSYCGPNGHLIQDLLDGQDGYHARFKGCLRIHLPELGLLLRSLGDASPMFDENAASLGVPDHAVTTSTAPVPPPGEYQVFDGAKYLLRWDDVAATSMDPLLHYVRFGFNEGRPVP